MKRQALFFAVICAVLVTLCYFMSVNQREEFKVLKSNWPDDFVSKQTKMSSKRRDRSGPWKPPSEFDASLDRYLIHRHEIAPFIGSYIINKTRRCNNETGMVFLITSKPTNFERRKVIRETWASKINRTVRTRNVLTFFLLGATTFQDEMQQIKGEDDLNDDLIQFSYHDTYDNLTIKSILMLQWLKDECSDVKIAIKTDDDMVLDIAQFENNLLRPEIYDLKAVLGFWMWPRVNRDAKLKQSLPGTIYRPRDFPPFVSGVCYAITRLAVGSILKTALESLPALFLEDVFITGFMAKLAKVETYHFKQSIAHWACYKGDTDKAKNLASKAVIGHKCTAADMLRVFRQRLVRTTI